MTDETHPNWASGGAHGIDAERVAYQRQLDYLASRVPTDEQMAYLRNRMAADENAAWAWKLIKAYAPWVGTLSAAIGSAVYWGITHTITITGPK